MVWRQRVRPGKVSGQWVGPSRVLLQENHTLWLAKGATLIKARTNQVRAVTRREELQSSLEGTAILRMPVTLESLMREFSGKHFAKITGEVPSEAQQQADLEATTVQLQPQSRVRADSWKIDGQWLIRIHSAPRLALFTPERVQACPVRDDELTGLRQTCVKPMASGAETIVIEDQFREEADPRRLLQERWTGETRFNMKEKIGKRSVRASTRGKKRKEIEDPEVDPVEKDENEEVKGEVFPPVLDNELNQALQDLGPDAGSGGQATIGNQCVVADCTQPGGHYGPHVDAQGRRFTWNTYDGRIELEESDSGSSSSSEELLAEEQHESRRGKLKRDRSRSPHREQSDDSLYVFEIDLKVEDMAYLSEHPKKASVWLAKSLEKGKEEQWSKMSLEQKGQFDLAQAKELNNVVSSKALRALRKAEHLELDHRRVMTMRWVLTTKQDGSAKARLVVLGFQAPNICQVQTAAPTMTKLSRNMMLSLCANFGLKIRGGDVTSAFLQADQDLESENLTVWAPAELAVMYGADASFPVMPLRIRKAFYGLVHSPRVWFEHLSYDEINWVPTDDQ